MMDRYLGIPAFRPVLPGLGPKLITTLQVVLENEPMQGITVGKSAHFDYSFCGEVIHSSTIMNKCLLLLVTINTLLWAYIWKVKKKQKKKQVS